MLVAMSTNLTWIVCAFVILQIIETKAGQNQGFFRTTARLSSNNLGQNLVVLPTFLKYESKHPEPGKFQLKSNNNEGVLRIQKKIFQGTEIRISVSLPHQTDNSKCSDENLVFGIQEIDCEKIVMFHSKWKKFKLTSENNNVNKNCHKRVLHLSTEDLINKDGNYLLEIRVEKNDTNDDVTIELEFFGDYGYQIDWPLYQYLYHLFLCALCFGLLIGIFVVLVFLRKDMGKMQ